MQEAVKWINEHQEKLIKDICTLVSIPSISAETGDPSAPYGAACLQALEASLAIGLRMGFTPFNHDNHCGSLLWQGEKETEIGIFGHTDVVPPGGGWTYQPFEPTVEDGMIIGRGASDNKGSLLAALYALYYLKEQGYQPKNSFRFFLGCDEEVGMGDVEHYVQNYGEPAFSIVPDVEFPLCHGEKGMLKIEAERKVESSVLLSFSSGVMANAVPAEASCTLKISAEQAERIAQLGGELAELEQGLYQVSVSGIAAHAAFPEGSENAQLKLARILSQSGVLERDGEELMHALCVFFSDHYGAGLGVPYEDELSGKLTHVGGMASLKDGVFWQSFDIRYNVKADQESMIETITRVLQRYGFKVTELENSAPYYIDPKEPIVQRLVEIANTHLEAELTPYLMGGGTYARKLKRAVGFGPGIPGRKSRFGSERGGAHQPDEYVEIEDLKKAFLIFVEALQALDQLV